jgi:single-strand DNA-binding protein
MYLNKAIVYGNLTRDPEMKALPSGVKVTSFAIATNRIWKDKDGKKQESVDYHNVVVFGRAAETSAQYLRSGSSVLVEGRMQTRSWDAKDGTKRYRTEIIADSIQFGPKSGGKDSQVNTSKGQVQVNETVGDNKSDTIEYPEEEINPDDIPF